MDGYSNNNQPLFKLLLHLVHINLAIFGARPPSSMVMVHMSNAVKIETGCKNIGWCTGMYIVIYHMYHFEANMAQNILYGSCAGTWARIGVHHVCIPSTGHPTQLYGTSIKNNPKNLGLAISQFLCSHLYIHHVCRQYQAITWWKNCQ